MTLTEFNPNEMPYTAEWVVIGIAIVNFIVNASVAAYLLYWRNWPPIRAKQLDLFLLSAFAGWSWLLGAMSVMRLIPQVGAMLACNFWTFWYQFLFGSLLWIVCIIMRMYRLYVILVASRMRMSIAKNPRLWIYIRLVALCIPYITFAIIATAVDANGAKPQPTTDGYMQELCSLRSWALYVLFMLTTCYLAVCAFFIYKLRNIRKFLNEYRESKIAFGCIVFLFIVYIVIHVGSYQRQVWGRVLATCLILVTINVAYWVFVGRIVYGRWFNPEEFLAEFQATKDYEYNSTSKQSKSKGTKSVKSNPDTSRSSTEQKSNVENQSEFEIRAEGGTFALTTMEEVEIPDDAAATETVAAAEA
ncbi:hypothetical protein CAOG_04248 [Capsaspora owczarzaki ATCC 30864]|uniref:G-protein coupled receptors family 2 profile 2 domain-containing protein n=1 Tax=Capsaspora owczarzaki (strain ATCC 30864) TaxID=595528 RepID=A0A0D2WPR0_CAPO3|nr:hypothetical protein CAOG_04248 [Capsaspora owczarzaki ATCC 30864]KJE93460.1 hypothetical protein CAOG_004248 [Capsaspora owczarzaki ATCC 30864]|eukprot:XP_004348073.2 hypothetical protein CAOG_04248 [Capsaspora owczarzaki ATCC 30864]